ncbi:protein of unknown function (plasmid) [Caballeronia sp. S22]
MEADATDDAVVLPDAGLPDSGTQGKQTRT